MLLHLSDFSNEPLHAQISRQIRERVLAGELEAGSVLPSIRGLAKEYKVSVITVQRAYEDLEREGLLMARRGKGFFVAEQSDERRAELALERIGEELQPILRQAMAMGLDRKTLIQLVKNLLEEDGGRDE